MTAAALLGCGTILFNAFWSGNSGVARLADVPGGATTRVTVTGNEKTSRTITLKYDPLVEDIQRELLATGHFNGLVDGVTGPKTKVAIEAYQHENKIDVNGVVSKHLLEHIHYTRKLNQAAEFTGSVAAPRAIAPKPEKLAAPLKAAALPAAKAGGDNAIAKLQERLARLGYDPGSRSGQLDEGTRSAILIFEMDHGLPMQGRVSKPFLAMVKSAEAKARKKP